MKTITQSMLIMGAAALAACQGKTEEASPKGAESEAPPLVAAEKKPEKKGPASAADTLATALGLLRYGAAKKDPVALVLGAKMLKETGAAPLEGEKETVAAEGKDEAEAGTSDVPTTAGDALAMAKELAEGDERVLAMVTEVEAMGESKGPTGGTILKCDVVRGYHTDIWRFNVDSYEPLRIHVKGAGRTDLDCRLYDHNGKLAANDLNHGDYCLISGAVRNGGRWRLDVKNLGGKASKYCMLIE